MIFVKIINLEHIYNGCNGFQKCVLTPLKNGKCCIPKIYNQDIKLYRKIKAKDLQLISNHSINEKRAMAFLRRPMI